jgi:hypothetical protein
MQCFKQNQIGSTSANKKLLRVKTLENHPPTPDSYLKSRLKAPTHPPKVYIFGNSESKMCLLLAKPKAPTHPFYSK